MQEKMEKKIDEIIEHIIAKPVEEISMDDYTILSSEVRDIRFRKSQEESSRRMADLMALSSSYTCGFRS